MRPLILVTNDDGVLAPGIAALADAVEGLGDVIVCAPETERSGSSHAITFHTHLRAHEIRPGWWGVSGTPVDCVYLGVLQICDRRPDLVLSGINAGFNLGTDVFYIGTVGAAAEAHLRGVPALAVSCDRGISPYWAHAVTRRLARALLEDGTPHLVSVNVPAAPDQARASDSEARVRGAELPVEVTRLGRRRYQDTVEHRTDPQGRPYYWIGGPVAPGEDARGEDTYVVAQHRIAVTPLELDITAPDLDTTRALVRRAGK